MNSEPGLDRLMIDTFTAHEHLAPAPDEILSAVHDRIRRGWTRPVAAAAGAVIVVAAAGTAVALSGGPATSGRHVPPAAQSSYVTAASVQPATQSGELTMPYDLGWLPDGSVAYLARRINVGGVSESAPPVFDGEYLLTVTDSSRTIDIDVQQMPGGLDDAAFKSGPGATTTIDGRPGVQSSNSAGPGGYEVYFEDSDGGLMYVNTAAGVGGASIPAADLASIGRRVAEHVAFPGTTQVQPSFGIGYVPEGMAVQAFDVEDGGSVSAMGGVQGPRTSYELGAPTNWDASITVGQSGLPANPGLTPGRTVQGHPTRYADEGGYQVLYVLDAVDGNSVSISGRASLDELYRIADGLALPR